MMLEIKSRGYSGGGEKFNDCQEGTGRAVVFPLSGLDDVLTMKIHGAQFMLFAKYVFYFNRNHLLEKEKMFIATFPWFRLT